MLNIYLNGHLVPYDRATIHIEDRGFLLADGIYEVIRFYNGRPYLLGRHLDRLERSASAISLPLPPRLDMERSIEILLESNSLLEKNGTIYIQVTRGAYTPRTHGFPTGDVKPTAMIICRESPVLDQAIRDNGVAVVSVPDQRWARCDIKSIGLLPNVLAKQAAYEAGAFEAIFVKDGYAIEGSSTNLFGVFDSVIRTYPTSTKILSGVTRDRVIELAREKGYQVQEEGIKVEELERCSELFITSTTAEVLAVTSFDGRPVGNGQPGPVTKALHQALAAEF